MISLRRSGSGFIVGSTDIDHLEDVAHTALRRGERVELQLDTDPWRTVTTAEGATAVLDEMLYELDERSTPAEGQELLPLDGVAP